MIPPTAVCMSFVHTCVGKTAGSSGSWEYGSFLWLPLYLYCLHCEHRTCQTPGKDPKMPSQLPLVPPFPSACPHPGPGALETLLTAWILFGTTPYPPWGLSWGQGNLLKPESLHSFAWNTFYSGIDGFEQPKGSFWAVEVGDGLFTWESASLTWKLFTTTLGNAYAGC